MHTTFRSSQNHSNVWMVLKSWSICSMSSSVMGGFRSSIWNTHRKQEHMFMASFITKLMADVLQLHSFPHGTFMFPMYNCNNGNVLFSEGSSQFQKSRDNTYKNSFCNSAEVANRYHPPPVMVQGLSLHQLCQVQDCRWHTTTKQSKWMYAHIHIRTHACTQRCKNTCTHARTHTHPHTHTHTRARARTHTHTLKKTSSRNLSFKTSTLPKAWLTMIRKRRAPFG